MNIPNIETIAGELETPKLSGDELLSHIDGLERRYDEPWRHHHAFEHPLSMFGDLIRFRDEVKNPSVVAWTIPYHDLFFHPLLDVLSKGLNEELSAQLAEKEGPLFLAAKGVSRMAAYTRATAGHMPDQPDKDLEFFLDCDLSILGAAPARYDQYSANIYEEFKDFVPLHIYVPERVKILRKLASRHEGRGVYTTECFREEYGTQAESNITREIDHLESMAQEA